MENKIKVVGNVILFNTTIVGTSQSGKTTLGKQLQNLGYYYLDNSSLQELSINVVEIMRFLNVDNYKEATNKQNLILANIIDLIKKGTKRIIIDDLLTFIDLKIKKDLIRILKEKNIRFINITTDINDALFTDYVIVVFNNQVALEGNLLDVLKEEKIIKRIGLSLPFIIDLSIQLKYYGLVDKIYLNAEEMVANLWK